LILNQKVLTARLALEHRCSDKELISLNDFVYKIRLCITDWNPCHVAVDQISNYNLGARFPPLPGFFFAVQ
jgi:hypothetical protein